jgi:hypothetical protein
MRGFYIILGFLILIPALLFFGFGKEAFATVYEFSTFFYGRDLAQHLYGWNGIDFEDNSNYVPNGLFLYYVSLAWVIIYYYIIDSPSFSRMWHWGIIWLVNAIMLYFISFYFFAYLDYNNGDITSDIVDFIDMSNLHSWGFTNVIYALILFIAFSFSLRWWSINCSTTPIPR